MITEIPEKKFKLPASGSVRLEAFSDGVFAIAITLLVLEIKVPHHEELVKYGGLAKYLLHLWPEYISYFLSVIFIGIYWVNHHWLFSFVKKTNHVFNLMNVIFLMCISFLPFVTAILGDFVLDEAFMQPAITFYCIGFLLPVIPVTLIVLYATHRHRLVDPRLSAPFIKRQLTKLYTSLTCSTLSIIVSFYSPYIAFSIVLAMFILFLLPPETPVYGE
jgi:uncharacterized membrane protein